MIAKQDLTLAILAGGQGTRLGGIDKGALRCQGRTLLDRLMELGALCAATDVVTHDLVEGKGAPGGVVTALCRATTELVLVVCCDMPHVSLDAARALCAPGAPAVFDVAGRLEPFPGVYAAAKGPVFRAMLDANPSMSDLLARSGCVALPLGSLDPRTVRSVNTRADAADLSVDIP